MQWVGINLTGLLALALSGWSVWRTRHRVTVSCKTVTACIGSTAAGTPANHTYLVTTVRNVGRPIAVEDLRFEHVNPSLDGESVLWGSLPSPLTTHREVLGMAGVATSARIIGSIYEMPSHFGSASHRLEDGDSVKWACSLGMPFDPSGPPLGKQYRAAVTANGKTIRSKPFWHHQTPEAGW